MIKIGADEVEKALSYDKFMSAEEVSEKIGINSSNVRIHLNKLVMKYKTVEVKQELIDHNWRRLYRLK